MKKFLWWRIPDKTVLTREDFRLVAKLNGFSDLIGLRLYDALLEYAGDPNKINQKFLCKIPDDEIEQIKGIKEAGHKLINYLKEK